jgi:hypothetical protein
MNDGLCWSALVMLVCVVGCGGGEESSTTPGGTASTTETHTDDVHAHPSEGPHHGSLIELGNEEYHGEFLHDADSVTIYILDSGATELVPIEAESITLNVTHDGAAAQHTMIATPDESDPDGKSSRFVLSDADVVATLDSEGTTAKIVVTIEGTPYQGNIAHHHGDHGHAHD